MHSIQESAKNQRWMTFLSRMMSFSPVESSLLIIEIWEKYHQMRNEILQNIAVSEFSFEKIFFYNSEIWQQHWPIFGAFKCPLLSWDDSLKWLFVIWTLHSQCLMECWLRYLDIWPYPVWLLWARSYATPTSIIFYIG